MRISFRHTTAPARRSSPSAALSLGVLALMLLVAGTLAQAQIGTSVSSLSGFIQTNTTPCPAQSYVVTGTNISADVIITPPPGFKISVNQTTWIATPGFIKVSQEGPTSIPPTTIYVKLDTSVLGTYAGNIDHSSTDSPSHSLPVDGVRSAKSPSSTSLLSDVNPSIFGQTVMLTADVTSPLPGTPTGTVTFYDGASPLGTQALNISAVATLSTSALAFGPHTLTATYNSDATFDPSTSPGVSQDVRGTTTTAVVSNINPSTSGQSVTFTATVSSSFPGSPSGLVTFYDGAASLGSAAVSGGTAALSTSGLAPGSHSVTASYGGDVSFAGSASSALSQMVRALTTTALASNHNPSVTGQTVTLTATPGSVTPGTITGTVSFFDGASALGAPVALAGGTAVYAAAYQASGGSHAFTATYNGDVNYAGSTSSAVNQTVNKASTTAVIGAVPNPSFVGQSVTISATVAAAAPGSGTPVGSVIFSIDGSPSGQVSMAGGVASIATSSLALGIHTVTGSYGGDGDYDPITSSVYADSVDPVITATAGPHGAISPSGPVLAPYGGNMSFTISPAIGYQVDSLSIDGVTEAGAETYTFTTVTANHTIHATFLQASYQVTVTTGPNGSALPSGSVMVLRGDSLVIGFTGDPHYHVAEILLDGVPVGAATSYTLRDVLAAHTVHATFTLDTYTITATAGSYGSIDPAGSVVVPYGSDQAFVCTPDPHYAVDSIAVDGVSVGAGPGHTVSAVAADHAITVTFKLSPVYETRYRTFTYDSLIVKKAVAKKPVTQYWEFTLHNTLTADVTEVNLVFSKDVKEILSASGAFAGVGLKKAWRFSGDVLHPGDALVIKGRSTKAKLQQIAKFYLGPITRTPTAKAVNPVLQWSELPMPNAASVRDLAFLQAGFAAQPWIIGVAKTAPDSSKFYGWVALKKSANMYKSLFYNGTHTVTGNGFELLGAKPFVKAQSSLPPTKHNNKTFADLLSLKFNILLSQLGITTRGFGELALTAPASPFTGMLVREIAAAGDSMMTYHGNFAGRPSLYASLDSILAGLNGAFLGAMDTLSWSDSLRLKGTARLEDVPYLGPSGVDPVILQPQAGFGLTSDGLPAAPRLDQNYPNPFNPATTIEFTLSEDREVTLKVYNLMGQEVAVLADHELFDAGVNELTFDASRLASGVYFYRLIATSADAPGAAFTQSRTMVLIK